MRAGILRHVITVESPPTERLPSGAMDPDAEWTPFCTIRAQVRPNGGTEIWGASVFNPEATHLVTIRYYPGLTAAMRVNFNGRVFNILNSNDDLERHDEILLLCTEGRSHGVVI